MAGQKFIFLMAAVKTHLLAEEARGNSDSNARTVPSRQCASRKMDSRQVLRKLKVLSKSSITNNVPNVPMTTDEIVHLVYNVDFLRASKCSSTSFRRPRFRGCGAVTWNAAPCAVINQRDRSDRCSSLCSTPTRSHARTSLSSPLVRKTRRRL